VRVARDPFRFFEAQLSWAARVELRNELAELFESESHRPRLYN
jgi:hypothetical protein